ncbi:hypothetical protein ACOSP7_018838 [Xanthoceras sorbifolium]
MLGWQEWIFGEVVDGEFPHLKELYLQRCPKLRWSLPKYLPPTTKKVEVSACPNLLVPKLSNKDYQWLRYGPPIFEIVDDLQRVDSNMESELKRMTVSKYSRLTDLPPRLYTLTIDRCVGLVSLPQKLTRLYLRKLILINCRYLESFHGGHPPIALECLHIHDCRKLEFLSPATTKSKKSRLQYLSIQSSCDSLRFLPLDLFPKLEYLTVSDCANLSC